MENLISALKRRYRDENVKNIAKILLLASRKGEVSFDELEMDEDEKVDTLLFLFSERLLIPKESSRTLAWEDRIIRLRPGEVYIVPNVVRNLVDIAVDTGCWNPDAAVARYLDEIGEDQAEKVLEFFKRIRNRASTLKVTKYDLTEEAEKLGLSQILSRIIAEFKGAGILSPSLLDPKRFHYELNPSLLEVERCETKQTLS